MKTRLFALLILLPSLVAAVPNAVAKSENSAEPVNGAESKLAAPNGEVILEVYGNITVSNVDGEAHFDRQMIEAFPTKTIVTTNHVVSTPTPFRGPLLADVLNKLGAEGETIIVTALDDYSAELRRSDIEKYGVILATHESGKRMTIDDRGPFFVVFPFDDYKEIQQDLYYNMSVWQVSSIEVE